MVLIQRDFIAAKSCSWHRLCKLFSMLYSERCHIWQRQQSSMNLLLFSIEHQNPGHQKQIQHRLPRYCVESSAILTSTNRWGDAVQIFWPKKGQMEQFEAKAVELCGAGGTMAHSGPAPQHCKPKFYRDAPQSCSQNNNLPSGRRAFRVCRAS